VAQRAVSGSRGGIVVARGSKTVKPRSVNTERAKTSVSLLPQVKYKLATLKAELRLKGLSVSESDVMEALIVDADAGTLARLLKSR
jgi:hypothetical protein